ncbi:Uncharacterised protein [Raoultella planticola]|uniref:Uncharacterized protein n=1 Tax=Raoultella planticola TaxID=575 RepID=A0A485CGD8_RAOPL|nr:Uncharacterised protein [Raoultella planticola]
MAAGTGIFRRIDAGNAIQDFAHGGGAGFGEIVAADNIAGASMFKNIVFPGVAKPVADHRQRGFRIRRRRFQRPGLIAQRLQLQPATVEQRLQTVFHLIAAVQAIAVFSASQAGVRRERNAAAGGILVQGAV